MEFVTTSYRFANGVTEVLRNEESVWSKVNVPDISSFNVPTDAFKTLDFSSPGTLIDTYIQAVDMSYYKLMSQTELTDYIYRMSSWTMGSAADAGRDVITSLIKLF